MPPSNRPTLIALDEDMKSLRDIEEMAGDLFNVVCARTSERLLSLVQHYAAVTTIIVEHALTGGSGIAVLQAAQKLRPEVRRVLMTGSGELAEIIEALHCGAVQRIVYKPLRAHDLNGAIAITPAAPTAAKRATA